MQLDELLFLLHLHFLSCTVFLLLLLSLIIVPEHTCLQQETYHHTSCAALLLTACILFQNNHSQSLSSVLPQFRLYIGEREGRPKRSQSSQRFTFYRSSLTAKKKITQESSENDPKRNSFALLTCSQCSSKPFNLKPNFNLLTFDFSFVIISWRAEGD